MHLTDPLNHVSGGGGDIAHLTDEEGGAGRSGSVQRVIQLGCKLLSSPGPFHALCAPSPPGLCTGVSPVALRSLLVGVLVLPSLVQGTAGFPPRCYLSCCALHPLGGGSGRAGAGAGTAGCTQKGSAKSGLSTRRGQVSGKATGHRGAPWGWGGTGPGSGPRLWSGHLAGAVGLARATAGPTRSPAWCGPES